MSHSNGPLGRHADEEADRLLALGKREGSRRFEVSFPTKMLATLRYITWLKSIKQRQFFISFAIF